MSTFHAQLPLNHGPHNGGHSGQGSFIDTLFRGFAWRTGSDVANSLFHLAPTLIIAALVIILMVVGARWLRNRRSS